MAALASLTTPGGAIGDTFGGFVIAQVLDAPGGKYRWQVSEVNERTQRTSLLRGPVEDIPGLTVYLATNFLPLAGGTISGELFIASGGGLYLYDPSAEADVPISVDDGQLLVGGVILLDNNSTLDASKLGVGTVPDDRLSANVTLLGNTTTGTGSVVRATSPTFTTPVLGAASATTLGVGTTSPTALPGYSTGIEVRNTATSLPSIRVSNATRYCGLGVDGTNAAFSTNGVQFIIVTEAGGIGLSSGADRRLWVNNSQNTAKTASQLEVVSQAASYVVASFCGAVSQTGDYIRCVDASNNVLFSVGTTGNLTASGVFTTDFGGGIDLQTQAANWRIGHRVGGTFRTGFDYYHLNVHSSYLVRWSNSSSNITTMDTTLSRASAGVLQVGNAPGANALGSLLLANLTASGTVHGTFLPTQFTVATLPSAAANTGRTVQVTDSSVDFPGNIGNTVAGGGANNVDVKSNSTNWRITG